MKYLMLILLASTICFQCSDDSQAPIKATTIGLISTDDPDYFAKTVILFESDEYLVKTNYDTFISEYLFSDFPSYADLKTKAEQDIQSTNTINAVDYLLTSNDGLATLAHHLEAGNCLVYRKISDSIVPTVELVEYHVGGAMTSSGGRRFYLNGKLFVETVDWLS